MVRYYIASRHRTRHLPSTSCHFADVFRGNFGELSIHLSTRYSWYILANVNHVGACLFFFFFVLSFVAQLQRRNVFGARGTATLKLPAKCDQRDSRCATGTVSDSNRSMPRHATPRRATRRDVGIVIYPGVELSLTACISSSLSLF